MQIKCGGCDCDLEVDSRTEHTSPFGGKYYSVELCETCKILYKNLLDVMQDSLREGGKRLDTLSKRK